ncbi:MAG TPA: LysR family transcriptional regulator [Clostridiales bacterium]|nr:LysR family transcriptional regulator [Clostridiales bacterium]
MTLKQLQFFKKTAELENISKASKELYIAQPALSKAIKDLEQELGYALFERNGKKISLNKNGDILYKYVLKIYSNVSHMENELKEANQQKPSAVNVSVRVASKLLPAILSSFYSKYPSANLKIHQMTQASRHLPDHDIIIDSKEFKSPAASDREQLLLEERILLALPCCHPLAKREKIFLADLDGEPCCLLNEFSSLGKMVRSKLSVRHFTPKVIFESDNPHMIRDFLRLDLSYSLVPETSWQLKQDFPNLVLKEVEDFSCHRYIYLSYGQSAYVSQAAKEFSRHVRDYFIGIQKSPGHGGAGD